MSTSRCAVSDGFGHARETDVAICVDFDDGPPAGNGFSDFGVPDLVVCPDRIKMPGMPGASSTPVARNGDGPVASTEDFYDRSRERTEAVSRCRSMEVAVHDCPERRLRCDRHYCRDGRLPELPRRFDVRHQKHGHQRVFNSVLGDERETKFARD